MLLEKDMILLV